MVRPQLHVRTALLRLLAALTFNLALQILQLSIGFVDHFIQLRVDMSVFLGQILAQVFLVGTEDCLASEPPV
jgi:hypothetical protein